MYDVCEKTLVGDIARNVVANLAPHEIPMFQVVSSAYFEDPSTALSQAKPKDTALGFGIDDSLILLTPFALHVVSEVFDFLVSIARTKWGRIYFFIYQKNKFIPFTVPRSLNEVSNARSVAIGY